MRIGFASQNPTSHYWLLVGYGVRERAAELGIDVTLSSSYTLEQQIAAIHTFVDQRVDALLLGPIVASGLANSVERVRMAGIPVIVLAAQLSDSVVACTVRSDHRAGAELAAAYLVELIGGRGEVAHLVGPSRLQDNVDRALGVRHVLSQHPGIQLAFEQESPDWEPTSGAALMRDALARCPHLRGVCVANDTLALGAIEAIEAAGLAGKIAVTGFDATPDALVAIHEGRMNATVRQAIRDIGRTAVEMAHRVTVGEDAPSLVYTEIALVTRENLLDTTLKSVYLLPSVLSDVVERGEALARAREAEALREQQLATLALQERDERFRRLAEAAFEGIVIQDQDCVVDANQAATTLFGYDLPELIGKPAIDLVAPEAVSAALEHVRRQSEQPYESLVVRKDGSRLPVEVRGKVMLSDGRPLRISAIHDITERKQAEAEREQLLEQVQHALMRTDALYRTAQALSTEAELPQLLQTVVDHTVTALPADRVTVITFDQTARQVLQFVMGGAGVDSVRLVEFDELWSGLSGWVMREGRSAISSKEQPDPRESPEVQRRRLETNGGAIMVVPLHYHETVLGTITAINRMDQPDFTPDDLALLEAMAHQAATAISNVLLVQDVRQLAVTDELTQLLNRRGFFTLGDREISRARRHAEPICAVMLDIDLFKRINDGYGHAAGDQVLQEVAHRLRSGVRDTDVLGRLGGEEFALLLPHTTSISAQLVAERLRLQIAASPVETTQATIPVTVSLGVATYDDDTPDLGALLQRADAALYQAKQAGRNRVVVHGIEDTRGA